ncbi:hypothetical protein K491DRAFT_677458 [Lophiostoma macrostomum CBS 122681]|uniref:Uncharacterized protein n=1 Tax=Lophiostoma macrostomum CBS 122681 TaxID=1314788 RepID=A0A6A6TBC7_9PLEO|nr:hypothetical protein K491DRAFT_677458 [Lophiostoma macrostomum CBS 122681]
MQPLVHWVLAAAGRLSQNLTAGRCRLPRLMLRSNAKDPLHSSTRCPVWRSAGTLITGFCRNNKDMFAASRRRSHACMIGTTREGPLLACWRDLSVAGFEEGHPNRPRALQVRISAFVCSSPAPPAGSQTRYAAASGVQKCIFHTWPAESRSKAASRGPCCRYGTSTAGPGRSPALLARLSNSKGSMTMFLAEPVAVRLFTRWNYWDRHRGLRRAPSSQH